MRIHGILLLMMPPLVASSRCVMGLMFSNLLFSVTFYSRPRADEPTGTSNMGAPLEFTGTIRLMMRILNIPRAPLETMPLLPRSLLSLDNFFYFCHPKNLVNAPYKEAIYSCFSHATLCNLISHTFLIDILDILF